MTTESKLQWKSTYKSSKLKENTLTNDILQLFKKFQTHCNEFENLSIIYSGVSYTNRRLSEGGHTDPSLEFQSDLKLDQFLNQMEKLELQQKSERLHIYSKYQIIATNIHKLKAMIESFQQEPSDAKLKHIERLGNEIENDLVDFKQAERQLMETLNTEEKLLEKDLEVCVERIQLLEKQRATIEPSHVGSNMDEIKSKKDSKKTKKSEPTGSDIPPEIEEFNRFLNANGGRCGGWDPEDHQIFLSIKAKAGSNKQFLFTEVAKRVPGQTLFTVQQHLKWYIQFLDLKKKKQDAIAQWRMERDKKRIELIKQRDENELKELEMQDEESRKQKLEEQKRKHERIKIWKAKKIEEKKKLEEEQLLQQLEEKRLQQMRELENKQKKLQLQRMKQEREASEKEKELAKQLEPKPRPISSQDARRLEERNKLFLKRRQALSARQAIEREQREERVQKLMEAVHVEGKSDSSRLTSETAAHRSRKLDLMKHGADNRGAHNFNIRQVQHRAMPSWRRGM